MCRLVALVGVEQVDMLMVLYWLCWGLLAVVLVSEAGVCGALCVGLVVFQSVCFLS